MPESTSAWLSVGSSWNKFKGNAVHAVTYIFFRELLSGEDVAQMSSTVSAGDFSTAAVRVHGVLDGAGDFIIKSGPTAA